MRGFGSISRADLSVVPERQLNAAFRARSADGDYPREPMRSRTLIVVLVLVAALAAGAYAMHAGGGGMLTRWLPALHGH